MRRFFRLRFLIALLITGLTLQSTQIVAQTTEPRNYFSIRGGDPKRVAKEALIRRWGVTNQRDKIPELITIVQKEDAIELILIAIRSLSWLGVSEALPDIDVVLKDHGKREDKQFPISDYLLIFRARLIAEAGSKEGTPEQKAETKLRLFLESLHLTVESINTIVAKEKETFYEVNLETLALREIADMIYRSKDEALLQLTRKQELKFSIDEPADVKIRLSLKDQKQRVDWIINELANAKALREKAKHEFRTTRGDRRRRSHWSGQCVLSAAGGERGYDPR